MTTTDNPETATARKAAQAALLRLDGEIRADSAYSLVELAKKMGLKEGRHVAEKLEARGIVPDEWGRGWHRTFVSGRLLVELIDRANRGIVAETA